MPERCKVSVRLMGWAALLVGALAAGPGHAQAGSVAVGASYTVLHTNLLPGCNCFGLQGGSGEVQVALTPRVAAVGEVMVGHRGGLGADGYALTQSVFSAGVRYMPLRARVRPFGELLLGGAHAGGSLSPAHTGLGSAAAFAFQAGGGLLLPLGGRWELKPAQIDYLLTTFANGANDRQNDLRVSAGVVYRLRR